MQRDLVVKKNSYHIYLLVLAIYFLIAFIFTHPLIGNLTTYIYGNSGDPFGSLWSFWWNKNHLIDLSFPNQPTLIIFGKFLTILINEVFAYNFIIISGFILSGFSIFLIIKKLVKNNLAAFFSGLVFMISPYHLAQAQQHLGLANLYWLGFFIYYLISFDKLPDTKNAILLGLFFSFTCLDTYQYGFFAFIILLIFILWKIIYRLFFTFEKANINSELIKNTAIPIVLSILFIAPFVMPTIGTIWQKKDIGDPEQTNGMHRDKTELSVYSARAFNYLLPSPKNPIFGNLTKNIYQNYIEKSGSNLTEQTLYLGIVPMFLALFALIVIFSRLRYYSLKFKFRIFFFGLIALIGLIFSFSPSIELFGLTINMPSSWLYNYIPILRVYSRFGVLVMLGVSVLAGIGTFFILKKFSLLKNKIIFLAIISLLVIIEFMNFPPFRVSAVNDNHAPRVYEWLSKQKGDLYIAEYPFIPLEEPKGYDYLLWQRIHKKNTLYTEVFTSGDLQKQQMVIDVQNPAALRSLKNWGVDYIIIHQNLYNKENGFKYPLAYNHGSPPNLPMENLELVEEFGSDLVYRFK